MADIEVQALVNFPGIPYNTVGTVDDQDELVKAYLAAGKLAKVTGRKKAAAQPDPGAAPDATPAG